VKPPESEQALRPTMLPRRRQFRRFEELQPLVKAGQQVIVWGDDGRKTEGRVVSLTGNQFEIRRRRWFRFRQERLVFAEDSVGRIEHRDSTWNGELLGLGIGSVTTLVACKSIKDPDDWSCLSWIALAPTVGLLSGQIIDGAINRTYVSPGGTRVTLLPLLGRERAGLAATLWF
jgi:hypothetical protein